jgi:hypothetical protein
VAKITRTPAFGIGEDSSKCVVFSSVRSGRPRRSDGKRRSYAMNVNPLLREYLLSDSGQITVLHLLRQNWGNLASVGGLLLSAAAALFARRASEAAKKARDAVYRRNLADDLQDATRVAADVVNLVATAKYDVALRRAAELQERIIFVQQRWETQLPASSKAQYQSARVQSDSIEKVLANIARNPGTATARTFERLDRSCSLVRVILVEEHAIALRAAEGVKDEG